MMPVGGEVDKHFADTAALSVDARRSRADDVTTQQAAGRVLGRRNGSLSGLVAWQHDAVPRRHDGAWHVYRLLAHVAA